ESTFSACGRNNEASSPALRRGLPSRPTTRGSAATCAAKASFSAQAAKVPFDTAVSKAARAYGRARVSALDMGSDLAHELVEQILVRVGIDLALEDLFGTGDGQRGNLGPQFLAGTVRHALDFGGGNGFLLGAFDDGIGARLVD